jgi:CubicO group peptidase (beta-lactamase class C family)
LRPRLATAALSVVFVLSAVFASAQVPSSQIDSIFASLKSSNAPGAAVLVVHNGRPVFRGGYGVTDLRTLQAIDAKTKFSPGFVHQAVHRGLHHAAGARRQTAL